MAHQSLGQCRWVRVAVPARYSRRVDEEVQVSATARSAREANYVACIDLRSGAFVMYVGVPVSEHSALRILAHGHRRLEGDDSCALAVGTVVPSVACVDDFSIANGRELC